MGTPTPGQPLGGTVCRLIRVPRDGNGGWLQAVDGALSVLLSNSAWEQIAPSSLTASEAAEEFLVALYESFCNGTTCMFVGQVITYISEGAPQGTLALDGSTYDKDDYPDLHEVLPSSMKTATTFTLPDMRERVPRFVGGSYSIGDTGGQDAITLSESEMPAHTHTESIAVSSLSDAGTGVPIASAVSSVGLTGSAGGGMPHDNVPAFVTVGVAVVY